MRKRWLGLLMASCLVSGVAPGAVLSPDQQAVHVLDRLGFGPRPGDLKRVEAIGVDRYIDQQLAADQPEPATLAEALLGLETLQMTPGQLWLTFTPDPQQLKGLDEAARKAAYTDARKRARVVLYQARQARLLRALYSPNQLQEVMTDFWFNHFNIFAYKGLDEIWTGAFEEQAIRPHALGHFCDLLVATARHPAMMFYLDNIENSTPNSRGGRGKSAGINENYARELMELHTLGVNGGYTQQDVIALAHMLTGWGYPPRQMLVRQRAPDDPQGFYFDARRHDFSAQQFLGHTIPGGGEAQVETALDLLAESPATARHISFELAQYFVSDQPDPALVDQLTHRWLATDGDIREVLRTLFHSPQFRDARNYGSKFKTPYQYVLSCVRASGVPVTNVAPLNNALQTMGQPLYAYITPDGYKNTADVWLNPDAMTKRLNFATALAAGHLPLTAPEAGLPGIGRAPMMARPGPRMMEGTSPDMTDAKPAPRRPNPHVESAALLDALGNTLSSQTLKAALQAPLPLQAAVILGSPDFMRNE